MIILIDCLSDEITFRLNRIYLAPFFNISQVINQLYVLAINI